MIWAFLTDLKFKYKVHSKYYEMYFNIISKNTTELRKNFKFCDSFRRKVLQIKYEQSKLDPIIYCTLKISTDLFCDNFKNNRIYLFDYSSIDLSEKNYIAFTITVDSKIAIIVSDLNKKEEYAVYTPIRKEENGYNLHKNVHHMIQIPCSIDVSRLLFECHHYQVRNKEKVKAFKNNRMADEIRNLNIDFMGKHSNEK